MYDVIVCGAGPAGAMAAKTCAERGLSVLLVDAARLPRHKSCAGGLTVGGAAELPTGLPDELAECRLSLFRAVWFGEVADVRRPEPYVISVDRSAFDHWLVRLAVAAGARLKDGERVTGLTRHQDSVLVITGRGYYRARAVIGCDGVNSIVARYVRRALTPRSVVLTACAEVPADEETAVRLSGNGFRVEYGSGPVGYRWALPKRGRINIGVGALGTPGPTLGRELMEFARRSGLPAPEPRFHLVPLGYRSDPVIADSLLLAGDAAGLADPFTGEGMRYALASGRLAGAVLADALVRGGEPDKSALAPYATLCDNWRADFRAAWHLTGLVSRNARLIQRLAFDNDGIFQRLLGIAEGRRNYRELLRDLAIRTPAFALASARASARNLSTALR